MENHSTREFFAHQNYNDHALNIQTINSDPQSNHPDEVKAEAASYKEPALQYIRYGGGILITGETMPHKQRLKAYGARWNPKLRGWVLQRGYETAFKESFADLL